MCTFRELKSRYINLVSTIQIITSWKTVKEARIFTVIILTWNKDRKWEWKETRGFSSGWSAAREPSDLRRRSVRSTTDDGGAFGEVSVVSGEVDEQERGAIEEIISMPSPVFLRDLWITWCFMQKTVETKRDIFPVWG